MPLPTFTPPPDAPSPTDAKPVFDAKAFPFVAWFSPFVTQLTALVEYIGSDLEAANFLRVPDGVASLPPASGRLSTVVAFDSAGNIAVLPYATLRGVLGVTPVSTEKTASIYSVDNSDHMKYLYFTNTSAKTVNVRSNAGHSLDDNYEINIRNAAASNLTIVGASGVTITPPAGGTLVVPPNGTVTLKRVGIDAYHLMGQVNAA
jgi:hypothetical protein